MQETAEKRQQTWGLKHYLTWGKSQQTHQCLPQRNFGHSPNSPWCEPRGAELCPGSGCTQRRTWLEEALLRAHSLDGYLFRSPRRATLADRNLGWVHTCEVCTLPTRAQAGTNLKQVPPLWYSIQATRSSQCQCGFLPLSKQVSLFRGHTQVAEKNLHKRVCVVVNSLLCYFNNGSFVGIQQNQLREKQAEWGAITEAQWTTSTCKSQLKKEILHLVFVVIGWKKNC